MRGFSFVQFENARNTRFEFSNQKGRYELLLEPLAKAGWCTWDLNTLSYELKRPGGGDNAISVEGMNHEDSLVEMTRRPGPVIYVGLEGAHIVQVIRDALEYIDRTGESWLIDLEECVKNWCRYFDLYRSEFLIFSDVTEEHLQAENATTVAVRGTRYVQFFDDRRTRFEFRSDRERWKLQGALFQVGWGTFDME